ncbi:MAG: tape measure protein [Psychrobium sp.]
MATETLELKADSRQIRRAEKDLDNLSASGGRAEGATNKLRAAFAGLSATLIASRIAKTADAYTSLENRLRIVTSSTQELKATQEALLAVSIRSRTDISATVDLYSTLARSTEELNISGERLQKITETIGKSFALSGADAASAAGAIRQLGQGLASGALRGDEFNSVAEQAPEIMRAIAKETGLTIGELRKFAAEGGITTELLIASLENYEDAVNSAFGQTTRTMSQSLQEASNIALDFVGSSNSVQAATQTAGESVIFLANNLDKVVLTAQTLAVVISAKLVGSVAASATAFTAAQIQAVRYQATLATMAGVSQGAATKIGLMSVATTGFSKALSLLGGPIGLAITAVGLLALKSNDYNEAVEISRQKARAYTEEMKNAIPWQERYAKKQEEINKTQGAATAISLTASEATAKLKETDSQIDRLQRRVDKFTQSQEEYAAKGLDLFPNARMQRNIDDLKKLVSLRDALRSRGADVEQPKEVAPVKTSIGNSGEFEAARLARAIEAKDALLANTRAETEAVGREYADRLVIDMAYNNARLAGQAGYFAQERALIDAYETERATNAQAAFDEETARIAENKAIAFENELLSKEERKVLEFDFYQQQIVAKQNFEDEKTQIEQDAADERDEILRQETLNKINSLQSYGNAALTIGAAFGSKSEKAEKKRKKASVIINTAAGIARAYADNDFYSATGMAVLLAAMGKTQIDTINSAGGGGGSISAPSVGSSSGGATPSQPNVNQQNQRRVVDIQIDDNAILTGSTFKEAMASALEGDEDLIIAVSNGQSQGQRTGLIPQGG